MRPLVITTSSLAAPSCFKTQRLLALRVIQDQMTPAQIIQSEKMKTVPCADVKKVPRPDRWNWSR